MSYAGRLFLSHVLLRKVLQRHKLTVKLSGFLDIFEFCEHMTKNNITAEIKTGLIFHFL